jgi:hypothetical protein
MYTGENPSPGFCVLDGIATITSPTAGFTFQPDISTYQNNPAINGTMFVILISENITLTPFNLSIINPFVVTGPILYQAGYMQFPWQKGEQSVTVKLLYGPEVQPFSKIVWLY